MNGDSFERERGATILVVDDMPQNLTLMRAILKNAGYKVIEANSGERALALLDEAVPDAVILDVRMPGMTGYEVCQNIRRQKHYAALPVILVTALSGVGERIKGIEAGATDFISKPFDKKELLARVKASLMARPTEPTRPPVEANLPGGVIITDAQWTVLQADARAAGALNSESSALIGRNLFSLLQERYILPEYAAQTSAQPWEFYQAANHTPMGRHTPISDAEGRVVMRSVVLTT